MQTTVNSPAPRTDRLIGALWVVGGAITIGLSEVAHVLGRTGTRLYGYDGGYAFWLGLGLVIGGIGLMFIEMGRRIATNAVDPEPRQSHRTPVTESDT